MQLNIETTGNGRDLVLIHGWGMNSAVWSALAGELAQRYRLHLIEMPGHGHSGYEDHCLELDQWVDAVLNTAPKNAVWIGWSLGSMLAQRAAVLAPERVQGLVSIAGTPSFVQRAGWDNAMEPETLRRFAADLQQDHAQTLERFLLLQAHGDAGMRQLLRPLREGLAGRPPPHDLALEAGLELLLNLDLRADLPRLQCPSMWLLGRRDLLVPVAVADDLQRLQPRAEVHVFRQAAHLPMLSDQARCLGLLDEFMSNC
jgi:pimeloyl-[acyl-carrier protein] methyl ester esterase